MTTAVMGAFCCPNNAGGSVGGLPGLGITARELILIPERPLLRVLGEAVDQMHGVDPAVLHKAAHILHRHQVLRALALQNPGGFQIGGDNGLSARGGQVHHPVRLPPVSHLRRTKSLLFLLFFFSRKPKFIVAFFGKL